MLDVDSLQLYGSSLSGLSFGDGGGFGEGVRRQPFGWSEFIWSLKETPGFGDGRGRKLSAERRAKKNKQLRAARKLKRSKHA